MDKTKHFLFILSPLILFLSALIFLVTGFDAFGETLLIITEIYVVLFFLASTYLFFRLNYHTETSKWENFIKMGYPSVASIAFAWIVLEPFMENAIGLWDSNFINMLVTLALSNFLFFWIIGAYRLLYRLFASESGYPSDRSERSDG